MAGIYIHIPFCQSRCIYCGFYSTTALELRQRYVDAVCREMELRGMRSEEGGVRNDDAIETIYIGGGTPSQLTGDQLRQLFDSIARQCPHDLQGISHSSFLTPHSTMKKEVTIEVNPDDVSPEFVETLSQLPVTRISMGAQTFDDRRLRFLHRRHTAAQVPQAVRLLREAGIGNISIDLMYGFPGETLVDWKRDIDEALALDAEHLSAYCLMVEEGTVLYEQMRNETLGMRNENEEMSNVFAPCDEETEREMYLLLIERLTAAGYEHYEISNFARPGFRSRHNSSYWHDTPYIGLGAAAHSYDGKSRSWNVSDIHEYMECIEHGELPSDSETLDEDTHYNDRITTALRTSDGLDLGSLTTRHRQHCIKEARRFIDNGLLRHSDDDRLILTRQGLFVSDMVMSALMLV